MKLVGEVQFQLNMLQDFGRFFRSFLMELRMFGQNIVITWIRQHFVETAPYVRDLILTPFPCAC